MPNRLSRMKVREISLVTDPASPNADIILTKSHPLLRTLGMSFDQFRDQAAEDGFIVKLREDNTVRDGEDVANANANAEAHREAMDMVQKRIEQRFGVRFAKANRDLTNGRSGGRSHSESDRVGVQDDRTDEEKAADLERIVEAATQKPPLSSERFSDWARRVYGAQLGKLDDEELDAARKVFAALRQHAVLKRRADEALDVIAKRMHAADSSRTYYQHWAQAAREHPELYAAVRGGVERVAKMDPPGSDDWANYYQPTMIGNGFGGGADASGDALDFLNREAADIQKNSVSSKKPLTKEQAFVQACKLHPGVYAKYRGRRA